MSDVRIRVERGLEIARNDLSKEVWKVLEKEFSYANPQFSKLQRLGKWTGNIDRTIESFERTERSIIFPRGGTSKIDKVLRRFGVRYRVDDHRLELPLITVKLGSKAVRPDDREHQLRMIESAVERENCLIRAATGSGKSEVVLEFIRHTRQPTVVVVRSNGLLQQWIERIQLRWGWPKCEIGVFGGGKKSIKPVTIATQQSIYALGDRLPSFVKLFGCLVVDEVHLSAARTFREIVHAFPARYRIGVSADERRKDRLDCLIYDAFGQVAEEVSSSELETKGLLCPVDIVVIPSDFEFEPISEAKGVERSQLIAELYTDIMGAMCMDEARNEIVRKLAARLVRDGESVLLFCNRVDQARKLARDLVTKESIPCGLMLGGQENREAYADTKARLSKGSLHCAIGTSATYQGEDIPRLTAGIVVTPTASNRQLINQQRGRLARTSPGKVRGSLYYIWDRNLFPQHLDNLRRWFGEAVRL